MLSERRPREGSRGIFALCDILSHFETFGFGAGKFSSPPISYHFLPFWLGGGLVVGAPVTTEKNSGRTGHGRQMPKPPRAFGGCRKCRLIRV